MLVFVYGTLMSGLSNHPVMRNPEFIGKATTNDKFTMYARGIPYVVEPVEGEDANIQGELYNISSTGIKYVDALEGHPDFYQRKQIKVTDADGKEHKAYMYFGPQRQYNIPPVKSGNYRDYVKKLRENKV